MKKALNISDYQRIATLNKEPNSNVDVYIATLKDDDQPDNFYIVNAFKHSKSNNETFRNFFFFYSSKNKFQDMTNFLTNDKYFFVIFKYNNYVSIQTTFSDEKNTSNYETRCNVLKDLLLKITSFADMPIPAVICATKPENICLDSRNLTQIIYNLEDYPKYSKSDSSPIYDNIADIIEIMLFNELKKSKLPFNTLYNKPLQLVLEKCRKHIYLNIPELIVDLEKAEKLCDVKDVKSVAMEQINRRKTYLKRFAWMGMGILIAVALFFLFQPLFIDKNVPKETPTTIGNTTYNQKENPSDKVVSVESSVPEPAPSIDFSDVVIPAGTDIPYTEYIVQYGDTLQSICKFQYNNENLVNAVATFNNITDQENLIAGSILKLPVESVIEEFLPESNSSSSSSSQRSFFDTPLPNDTQNSSANSYAVAGWPTR